MHHFQSPQQRHCPIGSTSAVTPECMHMPKRLRACCAGVPRLFDLVRVREERVKLAFYFALRDTVVAGNLDQASRIAYGKDRRWGRVVTIKVRHSCTSCEGEGSYYAATAAVVVFKESRNPSASA